MQKRLLTIFAIILAVMVFHIPQALAIPPAVEAKSEYMLADKLYNEGNFRQAIEHAEKARTLLGNSNSRIEYMLTLCYFKNGQYDKAMTTVNAYFELTPESESSTDDYNEMVSLYSQIKLAKSQTEIEMAHVPGGCFQMGDVFGGGDDDEKPVHEVCVDSFYMAKTEVTQGLWRAITGDKKKRPVGKDDNFPVGHATWDDVQYFLAELNAKTGKNYRLPTEAEWEYAARSGGNKQKYAGGNDPNAVAWHVGNSNQKTQPVATKQPNGLGLYDMTGNVAEYCQDWYHPEYYKKHHRNNPKGPSDSYSEEAYLWAYQSAGHVLRGGSAKGTVMRPNDTTTTERNDSHDRDPNGDFWGFRLVLDQ